MAMFRQPSASLGLDCNLQLQISALGTSQIGLDVSQYGAYIRLGCRDNAFPPVSLAMLSKSFLPFAASGDGKLTA
jgi:hypothetical protein